MQGTRANHASNFVGWEMSLVGITLEFRICQIWKILRILKLLFWDGLGFAFPWDEFTDPDKTGTVPVELRWRMVSCWIMN
jgi:hypothetical protein